MSGPQSNRRAPVSGFGPMGLVVAAVLLLGACAQSSTAGAGGFGGANGLGGNSGGATGGRIGTGAGGVSGPADAGTAIDGSRDAGQGMAGASGTGQGGASGGTGGTPGCTLSLTAVSPPSFDAFEAFAGATARVAASARGARSAPVVWTWTVNLEDPPRTIATTAADGTGAIVDFPVETEGRYLISARVAGEPLCGTVERIATARQAILVLRTTAGGFPTQDKQIGLGALDPQPTTLTIQLDPGIDASVAPLRADGDGSSLASYVRVSLPASALSIEGDTLRGPLRALLAPQTAYDLLVIPDEDYAPNLLSGIPGSWPQPLQLDRGIRVTATTRVAGGGAVVDARMILRRGALPSTVGASDAAGAMALWARAGTLAVFVSPPAGSGLPRASLGASGSPSVDPGLVLDAATAALDLQLTWDAVTTAPLTVEVHAPDGTTRVAGVEVRVRSHGAAAPVATLVARADQGAPVTLRASGAIDVDGVTDASGLAIFPSLPLGDFDLTVVPAPDAGTGAATPAITGAAVTVARGGLTRIVTLAQKVALTGSLLPAADSAGARVTAIDKSLTAAGTVVTGTVAGDGSYALSVDPARQYELLVDPAPAVARARALLGTVISGTGATAVGARTLPASRLVVGTVVGAGSGVSGARVQAFCPVWSSRCLDPTFSLADAVTGADGSFQLRLPAPAQN